MPKLTRTVVSYLAPQPTDRILDLGCGDGVLTKEIAAMVPQGSVLGLDASASMIDGAKKNSTANNCTYRVQDCTALLDDPHGDVLTGDYDRVFSNAAMHWILCKKSTRPSYFQAVEKALKPGGVFVFEMGGFGNCDEIHSAIVAGLVVHGIPAAKAHELSPWFFPSENWMHGALQGVGLQVEKLELEYRPTQLNPQTGPREGGLEGWLWLMAATFLEAFESDDKKEKVVQTIVRILNPIITREEDGSQWMGYVRLRGVARKNGS